MIKRYAVVLNGVVTDIVLWDEISAPNWRPLNAGQVIECPDDLHLGATHDGKKFTQPVQAPSTSALAVAGPDGLTDDERQTLKELVAKVTK